jgi:hypothetical protein
VRRKFTTTPTEYDIEQARSQKWRDEADRKWQEEQAKLPPIKPFEPCRIPPELRTPAQPGSFYAGRARAAGCEDAYDNEMEARYGEGW